MHDRTVIILADLSEFPQAQFYAHCYSVLFDDMGFRMKRNAFKPSRNDYTKVYIATKDKEHYVKVIENYAMFDCEFIDDVPDFRKKSDREVASWLLLHSFVEPFDDLKAQRIKEVKQARLEKTMKQAEAKGVYLDPNPDAKLDPTIKLMRKSYRSVK